MVSSQDPEETASEEDQSPYQIGTLWKAELRKDGIGAFMFQALRNIVGFGWARLHCVPLVLDLGMLWYIVGFVFTILGKRRVCTGFSMEEGNSTA